MAAMTFDELVVSFEEMHAGMARMREPLGAMGRSVSVLERTAAGLRQDVTRLGERVDGIELRLERVEVRVDARGLTSGQGKVELCPLALKRLRAPNPLLYQTARLCDAEPRWVSNQTSRSRISARRSDPR